jgi:hypothetical protein
MRLGLGCFGLDAAPELLRPGLQLMARSVSARAHWALPELGVDRLYHQPADGSGP